jgi:WD40 repeat protein
MLFCVGAAVPGNFLATASRDKTIKIWEVSTGQCIMTLVKEIKQNNTNVNKMILKQNKTK